MTSYIAIYTLIGVYILVGAVTNEALKTDKGMDALRSCHRLTSHLLSTKKRQGAEELGASLAQALGREVFGVLSSPVVVLAMATIKLGLALGLIENRN